jgi:acyl-CoA thioester hydrolase
MDAPRDFDAYPFKTHDKLRYRDTDRQGHVNNAVFTTFLETGRVEILFKVIRPLAGPNSSFVIVHLELDFIAEVNWPGTVDIGSRVAAIGNSSVKLQQGLFQNGVCVGTAETVMVLVDETTRRPKPFPEAARAQLMAFKSAGSPPG